MAATQTTYLLLIIRYSLQCITVTVLRLTVTIPHPHQPTTLFTVQSPLIQLSYRLPSLLQFGKKIVLYLFHLMRHAPVTPHHTLHHTPHHTLHNTPFPPLYPIPLFFKQHLSRLPSSTTTSAQVLYFMRTRQYLYIVQ